MSDQALPPSGVDHEKDGHADSKLDPLPSRAQSLIDYPCRFPIKIMGKKENGLVHAITSTAEKFDPQFDASTIELRNSKQGNYLGITIYVNATSREQLDDIYRALTAHPMVKVVL